jgi:DNA helicase IV
MSDPDPDPSAIDTAIDPALAAEQAHLDHAHRCLDAMRQRTETALSISGGATAVDTEVATYHLRKRAASFDGRAPLSFGRLDTDDGERFHVGRRHVEDDRGDPVVVDWRAPVSAPFYRATWRDPLGLVLRRRFSVEDRTIVALHDEDFTDPDSGGGGGIPDPLLAELERGRTGEMRDIVATIQAEQDEVIRAPLDQLTIVQGGPGTGKTAVGLHRAAYLLYEHRALLEERRVLVLGPNKVFLRYISEVLPSLGEHAVNQNTIDGLLAARYPVRDVDTPDVAALKGDARMATVLERALADQRSLPSEALDLHLPWGRVRLSPDDVADAQRTATKRALDDTAAREVYRTLLARRVEALLLPQFRGEAPAGSDFIRDAKNDTGFQRLVTRTWPTTSAPTLVRRVLGNRRALASASVDVLDPDEQAALHRSPEKRLDDERWTLADIPLLDEADALVSGVRATYGHVVVDEAQDLTAMALRMVSRRCPSGSITVLGDLAQATAAGAQRTWHEVADHLAVPVEHAITELHVGYRVPAPILDLASRLLPVAAPEVTPSRSIRPHGDEPWITRLDSDEDLLAELARRVSLLCGEWRSIGVVAPEAWYRRSLDTLTSAGVDVAAGDRGGLDHQVAVLEPATAKGLEFDAVVVIEPDLFLVQGASGARLLYVAMTRSVQHLSLLHTRHLPPVLAGS